jgi:nucleotide-binding universal stress UspA family protein
VFKHILLASDGSECALRAATAAATLASKFEACLILLNVFEPFPSIGPYRDTQSIHTDDPFVAEQQQRAISLTGRVVDEMDVSCRHRCEVGHPAAEILRVAEESGCDLIVLGSRGLSNVKAFLLGSVSDRVAHHAHCPVLIVK